MKGFIVILGLILIGSVAKAVDVSNYPGYTIVGTKTIVGYVQEDGSKKTSDDSFEGCDFDRKIIFDDRTYLVCTGYSYHYAYRPEATLLTNGSSWVMIVDDEAFEMRRY